MDNPLRLGFLYPGHAAEDDLPRLANRMTQPVEAIVVHTSVGEDAHRVDALLDVGSSERLLAGAKVLKDLGHIDTAMWACTSGSFVFGREGAGRQVEEIQDYLGAPVSSTSLAFVDALQALKLGKVALAASYPADVAELFAHFLGDFGTQVLSVKGGDMITAAEVGRVTLEDTVEFVASADHPDAEAVLVPDTALHTVAILEALEERLGKPVLTANQVTFWQALRLTGEMAPQPKLGALFTVT